MRRSASAGGIETWTVTTSDLVRWVYFGARWDMRGRRAEEPLPDDRTRYPVWPPLVVHPLGPHGLPDRSKPAFKPKIKRWMLHNIQRAAPTFGVCVGRSKTHQGGPELWVLKEGLYYRDARAAKTKKYAARKAAKEKAEKRKTDRYGKE
jgi:hypothetical protein